MEDTRTVLQAYKDVRKVIEALFITLQEDTYVLIRIQALVALVTAMFLVMFIVDFYRCRSRSKLLTTIFKGVDSLSDQIVVYLLGAMQSAGFKNQMFPVWAVVLVSLRASLGYLSGYGIPDRERRLTEVGNVIQFMGAGVLNGTHGLAFTKPLWSLWAILLLRSIYRFVTHDRAIRSLWHGRSSEFIPEYMRNHDHNSDHEQGNSSASGESSSSGSADNNMAGDHGQRNNDNDQKKYLVYGESNQEITLERPRYALHLEVLDRRKLITLDKISGCTEPLLSSSRRYKDISLAFTLSRLLRCRLEDVTLDRESIVSARKLITSNITDEQQMAAEAAVVAGEMVPAAGETVAEKSSVATAAAREIEMVAVATAVTASAVATATEEETAEMKEAKQKFRILELELAFVRDYFYTLYPMVFWSGLRSLSFSLLLSMATFAIAFWLAVDIRNVYYHAPVDNLMLQVHGGNIDVLITWVFMFFMMFKEVWEMVTYLLSNWTRLLLVCKYVRSQPWFRRYILKGGLISSFFDFKIATSWHGKIDQYDFLTSCNYKPTFSKLANAMTLGKTTLKLHGRKSGEAIKIPDGVKPAILQALRRIGLNNPQLPREIPSLTGEQFQRYEWACLGLHTCSEVILVWHIATSICEIKLAQEYDLTKHGFLQSAWSYLKNMCLCTSQPCPVDNNILQDGELKDNYLIANSLSRYCAYLQVFLSELLPDSFVVPELIFGETLQDAHKELKDCNLQQCRYKKLMVIAQKAARNNVDRRLGMNIVQQGATLGKALIENEDEESRWKILAGVWADLLVHIAPSWNAADHKYTLESGGGEFITLIWALLWHCGIEKSNLWNTDEVPENIAQAPQENMTETSNQSMEEQPIQDGIESSQEPKTSNSLRGRESTNAQIYTQNQTPIVSEANNGVSPSSFTN